MAPKHRIIIDTDPGVDDTLAMLLALSADPEELQVELISVTFGNVPVESCLRNVVSLFHHIEKEMAWRKSVGRPEGFDMLKRMKPLVAVGPDEPLADQLMMADYFHGRDGLGGIYSSHPHLTPAETWRDLFKTALSSKNREEVETAKEILYSNALFTASQRPAHEEILEILKYNEPDTITIVAIGPLTNLAIAAATDPETFLRVKEVCVMGGSVDHAGNVTPVAEFNTFADSIAAARLYALTSPCPITTMPPVPPAPPEGQSSKKPRSFLGNYPEKLSRQLKVTLFPLDVTTDHWLHRGTFNTTLSTLFASSSPLATWTSAFLTATFAKMESLHHGHIGDNVGLSLHDPLCIWYLLVSSHPEYRMTLSEPLDLRVETSGQWTRGMCVVDRRDRKMKVAESVEMGVPVEVPGDSGIWLDERAGNRVRIALESPGKESMGRDMLERIFGV